MSDVAVVEDHVVLDLTVVEGQVERWAVQREHLGWCWFDWEGGVP